MAGHSKFKNIQHRKGAQDKKRAKVFSRLSKEITIAAKMGMPDPDSNPRLRTAITAARAQNMPKDNIERAIKKSADAGGENYEEVRYEGFGPGGIGVIVETLTDNRNRTAGDVRTVFTKSGGNLGETGSVSFMCDRRGAVEYPGEVADADAVFDAAIEVDLLHQRLCLLFIVSKFPKRDRLPGSFVGPEFFLAPLNVVFDNRVGGIEDRSKRLVEIRSVRDIDCHLTHATRVVREIDDRMLSRF